MNRSSKLSVLVALALGSAPALALTLGQIQVKSALDRPLVAVIPLQEDFPGEANHLKVTLASDDAFTRAGINRANLKVPLTFTVATNANGQKVIRVTSSEPVREPYLDFLVQVSWPKGKLLREYVVLLDPVSMSAAPTVQPATAPSHAARSAVPSTPTASPAPAPSAGASGQAYTVKPGDTLSRIAQAHAQPGVSYQQMLVALQSSNPGAFFRHNINALKAGAILRIPSRAQATAVKPAAADAAVHEQMQAWRAAQPTAPTLVASAGGSARPVNAAGKSASSGDHLKLVPPGAGAQGAGGSGGQATVGQLREDLARSKEALSSQKQEAADLQSRVDALQKIADQNKRLLGLKNAQIAELQEKLAQTRKAAGMPPAAAPPMAAGAIAAPAGSTATASVATAASAPRQAGVAAAGTAQTAAALAGASAKPTTGNHPATGAKPRTATPAKPAKPAAARHVGRTAPAAMPWYQRLWVQVVLAIIVIVLLISWFAMRRRRGAGKAPKPSLADSFGDTPFGRGTDAAGTTPGAGAAAAGMDTPVVYTVDDDGEDELLAQLSEHPDNVDLHLELVSLYYARGDVAQFEAAAEAMRPCVANEADPEWQEVVAMGRELAPEHPLFAGAAAAGVTDTLGRSADALATDDDWRVDAAPEESDEPVEAYAFEEPPEPSATGVPEFTTPATSLPDESEFDALPPIPAQADAASTADDEDMLSTAFDEDAEPVGFDDDPDRSVRDDDAEPALSEDADDLASGLGTDEVLAGGFTDDPVDTKLDLARAYMDMGDHDGAQAMLVEAMHEGSQAQKEVAQKLLDELG